MTNSEANLPDLDTAVSVKDRLREDIVLGVLRPGEWLRQVDLQERYNCTQSAARAALAELKAATVVIHVKNRGFRVAETSRNLREDTTKVRLMLELPAVKMLVNEATAADIANIRRAAEDFAKAIETAPPHEIRRLNHVFHRAMYEPLQNATLTELINDLRERDLPGNWSGWRVIGNIRKSNEDHFLMVQALEDRDVSEIQKVLKRHLLAWQDEVPHQSL
ncbi:GntR family transcriptional regulator [uncultured Shimia sp.]|uniref:GntR family transcriptional regulator n=1 Tax=uncultured Shimia sp. TaxID=573152 RepID=UPI002607BCD5|nr:GntR family transcriptional regulator [uncultured Shimia sp.]